MTTYGKILYSIYYTEVTRLYYVIKTLPAGEVIFSYFSTWSASDIILRGVEDWTKNHRNTY